MTVPPAPTELDTATFGGVPSPLNWGFPNMWVTAGDGINMVPSDDSASASACLLEIGVGEQFPVYMASDAPMFSETCQPNAENFAFEAEYTVGVFGGDAFATNGFTGIRTPAELSVTAPDLSVYGLEVDRADGLEVAWDDNSDSEAPVIIRLWDINGAVLAASAVDDGSFNFSGDDLADLSAGFATITVTREHLSLIHI